MQGDMIAPDERSFPIKARCNDASETQRKRPQTYQEHTAMNIDDVKTSDVTFPATGQLWPEIFEHQKALADKYVGIERKNGFYHPDLGDGDLDDPQFQNWVKNMAWRTVEELAEAIEPIPHGLPDNWQEHWDSDHHVRHFFEELADAVHFWVELSLHCQIKPRIVQEYWEGARRQIETCIDGNDVDLRLNPMNINFRLMSFIGSAGVACNCLKNKPWKSTHMTTDRSRFESLLYEAWFKLLTLICWLGLDDRSLFLLYFSKHEVNKFRQATNY